MSAFWHDLQWQQPHWFALWLPLLLLSLYRQRGRLLLQPLWSLPFADRRSVFRHPFLPGLEGLQQGTAEGPVRSWRQWLALFSEWLLYLLLLAALAQPYRQGEAIPQAEPQREIMFLLDSSVSMVLRDYQVDGVRVDRIAMMKQVMQHLLQQLQQSRIGITVFSELSYTLVPLTNDTRLGLRMLQRLQPAMLTGRHSDVGLALISVERELRDDVGEGGVKPLLVLISDVQQSGHKLDPRLVAEYVHQQGYTLHTIAIGAATTAAQEQGSAGLLYQTTNFPLLEQMAERGGGRFFWAKDLASMQQALAQIRLGQRREQTLPPIYTRIPLYHWPLLLALCGLLGAQLLTLGVRR